MPVDNNSFDDEHINVGKIGEWGPHNECPFCGYIRQWDSDKYCGNCGARLHNKSEA